MKYFLVMGVAKVLCRGKNQMFGKFFFIKASAIKKLGKVKNFQVWVA